MPRRRSRAHCPSARWVGGLSARNRGRNCLGVHAQPPPPLLLLPLRSARVFSAGCARPRRSAVPRAGRRHSGPAPPVIPCSVCVCACRCRLVPAVWAAAASRCGPCPDVHCHRRHRRRAHPTEQPAEMCLRDIRRAAVRGASCRAPPPPRPTPHCTLLALQPAPATAHHANGVHIRQAAAGCLPHPPWRRCADGARPSATCLPAGRGRPSRRRAPPTAARGSTASGPSEPCASSPAAALSAPALRPAEASGTLRWPAALPTPPGLSPRVCWPALAAAAGATPLAPLPRCPPPPHLASCSTQCSPNPVASLTWPTTRTIQPLNPPLLLLLLPRPLARPPANVHATATATLRHATPRRPSVKHLPFEPLEHATFTSNWQVPHHLPLTPTMLVLPRPACQHKR